MDRESRHGYQSTREQNRQDQFRKKSRDPRDQHEINQLDPRFLDYRERQHRHRYESIRDHHQNHKDQLRRNSRDLRFQDQFTIQEIDPRFIDKRTRERREPRHLERERRARERREPRDGSNRRRKRSRSRSRSIEKKRRRSRTRSIDNKRKRSRSRSIDRKRKRTKIEKIEKGTQTLMGNTTTKDFSLNQNLGTNWFDLPRDVILLILSKVGVIEILLTLPLVCSQWQDLAKDPRLFRSVVLFSDDNHLRGRLVIVGRIIRKAADMSCGSLVEFWCSDTSYIYVGDLQHLTPSGSSIKSLRLGCGQEIDIPSLLQVIKCLPSLEDIYLNEYRCPEGALDVIGNSCPNLKFASLGIFCLSGHRAFSIANTMPGLHRLCLRGSRLTREGLQAILDGCRHLEYVHVKGLYNIKKLEGGYARRYQCKSYVKDYEDETGIWELELKLNDDCRPSLVGSSNGYEYSSLPFEDYSRIPFELLDGIVH